MNPATLVTTVAVATTARAMIVPVTTLFVSGAVVWSLLLWSFVRSLYGETTERTARRATSIARLPGRLGPLVHKEQRSIRTMLDLWMGFLPVLAAAALSLSISLSSTVRQAIFVIVCVLNANVIAELPWPGPTRRVDAIPHFSDSRKGSSLRQERGRDGRRGPAI